MLGHKYRNTVTLQIHIVSRNIHIDTVTLTPHTCTGTLTVNREHIYYRRGEVKGYMFYSMHDSDSMMIAGVILRKSTQEY